MIFESKSFLCHRDAVLAFQSWQWYDNPYIVELLKWALSSYRLEVSVTFAISIKSFLANFDSETHGYPWPECHSYYNEMNLWVGSQGIHDASYISIFSKKWNTMLVQLLITSCIVNPPSFQLWQPIALPSVSQFMQNSHEMKGSFMMKWNPT